MPGRGSGEICTAFPEVVGAHDAIGMPRCSAVKDPSGNYIRLYQG
jgi:hypothetical protein